MYGGLHWVNSLTGQAGFIDIALFTNSGVDGGDLKASKLDYHFPGLLALPRACSLPVKSISSTNNWRRWFNELFCLAVWLQNGDFGTPVFSLHIFPVLVNFNHRDLGDYTELQALWKRGRFVNLAFWFNILLTVLEYLHTTCKNLEELRCLRFLVNLKHILSQCIRSIHDRDLIVFEVKLSRIKKMYFPKIRILLSNLVILKEASHGLDYDYCIKNEPCNPFLRHYPFLTLDGLVLWMNISNCARHYTDATSHFTLLLKPISWGH